MAILFLAAAAVAASLSATAPKRNVLYVVFDDLRPDLSAYDVPFMKTPGSGPFWLRFTYITPVLINEMTEIDDGNARAGTMDATVCRQEKQGVG